METKDLTIIIATFKSDDKILSCLNSISDNFRILVIENSNNESFKQKIEKKFPKVECFLTGGNKGYAVANNLGLSKVKSKYALILNPDTIIKNNAIKNFFITANKNPDFWLIGPAIQQNHKPNLENNGLKDVSDLKGFAIFLNLEKFEKDYFDENFFLYFEEIDLCRKVNNKKGKIFLDPSIEIIHEGASSVDQTNKEELEKNRNWHWMWSTFYFHKKHHGYLFALIRIIPKMISSIIKVIFYSLVFNKKNRDIYFYRLSGLINSVLGKKSWYRPKLD